MLKACQLASHDASHDASHYSFRKHALAIVRQTVAIANGNTRNFRFLSTLISKAARAG